MKRLLDRLKWPLGVAAGLLLLGAAIAPGKPGQALGGHAQLAIGLVGGAGGLAWWWRRSRRESQVRHNRLRHLERIRLEPGRSLHLVEADGRCLLIGAGEGGVRMLARLDEVDRGGQAPGKPSQAAGGRHG